MATPLTPAQPARLNTPEMPVLASLSRGARQAGRWLLQYFQAVPLAVVLLVMLALATLAGVLIPQEAVMDPFTIKEKYGTAYRWMNAMGLFTVYSSPWFITLEILFFFNLLCGSFQWLRPAWRAATQVSFLGPEHMAASPNRFSVFRPENPSMAIEAAAGQLKKRWYTLHWNPERTRLYAVKGQWSRLGPAVAHTGILLMLIASVYGALTGFKAQKMVNPGESFNLMQVDRWLPNLPDPYWKGHVPDWTFRVDDFRIQYYPKDPTTPQQYFADLSVLNNQNKVIKKQTISVNHPLSIDDLTVYQASFNPTGKLFMQINGKPVTLETNTQFQNRSIAMHALEGRPELSLIAFPFFVQQDPGVKENYLILFLKDNEGFVGAAPGKMPENLRLRVGESGRLHGMRFTYTKPEIATGLQIKQAPEVPWIYLAFGIISLGTIMCIFSQRQIWMTTQQKEGQSELMTMFKTNKARLSFLKELAGLEQTLTPTNPQEPHHA
ncbi:MAG: cytochrome c biogenesis protein ResB [Candidatus Melainabacteria bacterium]